MIRLDKDTLYSRADLITLLEGSGVDPDFFIGRLKPRKRFRMLFWGQDLLDALAAAPILGESEDRADPLPAIPGRRRGRPPKQDKVAASDGKTRLIGGYFDPVKLGISPK